MLPHLRPGTVLIDMTSGEPAATQRLAERVRPAGGVMLMMRRSPAASRAPNRAALHHGRRRRGGIERVAPDPRAHGHDILRTGDVGSAHAMKALNNLVSAGGFLIGIEALLIGQRFGLDPALMVDVLNASTGMNNATQKKFSQFVLSRRFDSGFGLDLMVKDLGIAMGVARDTATPAPFAALCRELSLAAQAMLGAGADHTEFAKLSERLASSELTQVADPTP